MVRVNDVISKVKIYGFDESVEASKYPMSVDVDKCTPEITRTVQKLGSCETGTGHDQFLTGIIVQFNLSFTIKAWVEAERYTFLDFVSSQSTMHRISKFDIDKQCIEYVTQNTIDEVTQLLEIYNEHPTAENYLVLLYNTPVGFKLTARMTTNYRQLKTIYQQRKTHKLPEWRVFCEWCETLPYFKEIVLNE